MNFIVSKNSLNVIISSFFLYLSSGNTAILLGDMEVLANQQKQLIKLNLDDLLNIQVTSVSKKPQKISQSAAAIFVITHNDIKRSGVTSIPEALRMAPGIDVARIDNNKWAISSRGFNNGRFANKLLVLIDGRVIYTPFFSGVNWDVQDTLLEDIDRIEVIRGPGASLWGANAMNGVINIITKTARQTQGHYLTATAGSSERVSGGFRYGGQIDKFTHYRLYSQYFERKLTTNDNWQMGRGGGRLDWNPSENDSLTVQGDFYQGNLNDTVNKPEITPPYNRFIHSQTYLSGGNILLKWNHQLSVDDSTQLKIYYDYTNADSYEFKLKNNIFDIDFQHNFSFNTDHNVIWGAGYRLISDDVEGSFIISPNINKTNTQVAHFFIHDEWAWVKDKLTAFLGSRFERNDYSGFEIEPSAKIIWTPTEYHSIWASISRAVRTPSRAEEGGVLNQQTIPPSAASLNLPVLISLTGENHTSEELIAYELGYRFQPINEISIDTAFFYNDYDHLGDFESDNTQFVGTHFIHSFLLNSKMTGESYGAEFVLSWQVWNNWQIKANYSYIQLQLHTGKGQDPRISEEVERQTPHHKFSIRSLLNLSPSLDWDMWLRYADTVPHYQIPSYITLDTRFSWRPNHQLTISVIGQNLLDNQHPEFGKTIILSQPGEIKRGVYGKIEWQF